MSTFGFRDHLDSGDGAVRLAAPGSTGQVSQVILRAIDDDIYIGGYQVSGNLPNTGFKLEPGQEYYLTLTATGASAGSSDVFGTYIATTSETDVYYEVFYTPKL